MESLLHILDYDHYKMAKKVVAEKGQDDGFEAPRNSLELQMETLHNLHGGGDNIMYAMDNPYNWTEQTYYSTEASIKKLIREEKQNSKQNAPSVIARLMGVDVFPSEKKTVPKPIGKMNSMHDQNLFKESYLKNGFDGHNPPHSRFSKLRRFNSFDSSETRNPDKWIDDTRLDKPRPREHPQEEELQKFKKEFEACQAARIKECSKFFELGHTPSSQWLAQEKLNKEKINFYANSMGMKEDSKPAAHKENKYFLSEQKDSYMSISGNAFDPASEPFKIVILKPGPDALGINSEDSWVSSPCFSEERGSMEEFLEEVKERLKCELQGKPNKRSVVRGGGIETPYSEKPSDPKQIAQRIAKQVRESVTKDLGAMNLYRSESTRSYRSEMQFNGAGSPEFISRDTRKILAERLRNVLKEETHRNAPVVTRGSSRLSIMNTERRREEQLKQGLHARHKSRNWNVTNNVSDMQCRSFRGEPNANGGIHEDLSPRNLVRSLSAPVSGTSFGKLLLEDRHVLTGAHIRRKHETIEKITINVKKRKKEKFSLREKVMKYSLTFKGRLFGRKMQTSEQNHGYKQDHGRDVLSRPSSIMSDYDQLENFTEVPPSPASVCSNAYEEMWRPAGCSSPAAMSDVASIEDSMMPDVFREISSNLKELRRQLNELDIDSSEIATNDDQATEMDMVDIEDQSEAYIRDLLLISGYYDGSCDESSAKWEPSTKPIKDQLFEEVEESRREKKEDENGKSNDHKILFDLLNEALPSLLGSPPPRSNLRRKFIDPGVRPLHGRKLLDRVWQSISAQMHPPEDKSCYSLDMLIARDLQSSPWWSSYVDDDVNALGKDVECQIFGDLMNEMVMDMIRVLRVR